MWFFESYIFDFFVLATCWCCIANCSSKQGGHRTYCIIDIVRFKIHYAVISPDGCKFTM